MIKLSQDNQVNPNLKSLEEDPTASLSLTQNLGDELPHGIWVKFKARLWDRKGIRGRRSNICTYAGFCNIRTMPYYGDYNEARELNLLHGRDIVLFLNIENFENGYMTLYSHNYFNTEGISDFDLAFIVTEDLPILNSGYQFVEGVYPFNLEVGEFGGYKIDIEAI